MNSTPRLILYLMVLTISACRTSDPEPAVAEPWNELPAFTYFHRNAVGSGIWNDQLFVLTEFTLAEVKPDGSAFLRLLPLRARFPLPMTQDYIVLYQADPAGLVFIPTSRPDAAPDDRVTIRFDELGYGNGITIEQFLSKQNVAVNSNGQLLLPLRNSSEQEALFLFNVGLSTDRQRVEEVTYQKIDNYPDYAYASTIRPMGKDFLVSLTSTIGYTFKVYPDGQTKKVSDNQIFSVYPDKNQWYAAVTGGGTWLSEDNGETWATFTSDYHSLGIPDITIMQGNTDISGRRVLWNNFEFYEVTARTDKPGFENRRLNKDGLEGHLLLEFREWRGRVYAITPTGVFSRSIDDFFSQAE
ncbi:MAG: hypothetical protein ACKOZV_11940 [Bacteroidota bacterium]